VAEGDPKLGEVWWVAVDMPSKSGGRRKLRPAVVVTAVPLERTEQAVAIVPLSTSTHRLTEFDIPVRSETRLGRMMGINRDGAVFCSMPETVSAAEFTERMGEIDEATLSKVQANLRKLLLGD